MPDNKKEQECDIHNSGRGRASGWRTIMTDLEEYKIQGEPEKEEKIDNWRTAIGLQQVDGLTPSKYLLELAKKNIDGEITIYEVKERLDEYYKVKPAKDEKDRTEETDKVSARIDEMLAEKTFTFASIEYIAIHKRLFSGIYKHAGKIRDYNITKAEWVLDGRTVYYASADTVKATLDYDISQEKNFQYKGLSKEQTAEHFAKFISGLWQIHAFGEGNTRTTAVFAIKYLRTLGFNVTNNMFAENSWYFRNALVRANYNDLKNGIFSTMKYLDRFFGNLLLGEKNVLKNREMHVSAIANDDVYDTVKSQNDTVNDTVLSLIKKDPRITAAKITEILGIGIATVKRETKRLKENGTIERVGSDKTGHWRILK
ncbi:MAG: Fic family protein [Methanomassiliicoccaceae archaeon]|nr:Fic family protein [Methanomassiliicoccaceae archaeon]